VCNDSHHLFTVLIDNRIVYLDNPYYLFNGDVTIILSSFITFPVLLWFFFTVSAYTNCILFIQRVGKPKTTAKFIEKSINKRLSYPYLGCPLSHPHYTSNSNYSVIAYYRSQTFVLYEKCNVSVFCIIKSLRPSTYMHFNNCQP
jgi:hypothetical protein